MEGVAEANSDADSLLPSTVVYKLELKSSVAPSSSQPTASVSSSVVCNSCGRSFKTDRGLKQHAKKCKRTLASVLIGGP